jgi:type II secretory pathway pseudopilin PulG
LTPDNKESGFVLVEAIAALAIVAFAATALMAALGAAGARSAEARVRDLALRQAQVLMAEATSSPSPSELERQGKLDSLRLSWTRTLGETSEAYPGLQHIIVEVSWRSLQKQGVTHLEAYRITPPQQR